MLLIKCFDVDKDEIKTCLPQEVISHINKTTNKDFKKVRTLAWSFLIDLLENKFNIDFKHEKIMFTKNGKPYLKSNKLFFSLSHSLNLFAIAISNKPIGVDIEKVIPDNLCDLLSKRILNKDQYNIYLKEKDKAIYLTKIWTQKEAFVKCVDESILNINKLKTIEVEHWSTSIVKDSCYNNYLLSYYEK